MSSSTRAIRALGGLSQGTNKRASYAVGGVSKALSGSNQTANKHISHGQEGGENPGSGGEDPKKGNFKKWIKEHPYQAAAAVLAPPLAVAAVPAVLGGIGFTAAGVTLGMFLTHPLSLELTYLKS